MEDTIRQVGATMDALTRELRAVSHNLANTNTTGYKRVRTDFSETLSEQLAVFGQERDESFVDFTSGQLVQTGRPLDAAISGLGMFVLETPEGPLYTRNGCFRVNANGQLSDAHGRTVAGEGGPIVLPPTVSPQQVTIGRDGVVSAAGRRIGQLRVVWFNDPSVLRPAGRSTFAAPEDVRPTEADEAVVSQGRLESSNVSGTEELVRLITITRLYEANARSLRVNDQRTRKLLDVATS
jgi:flagellar basal body rod protein FlgG